MNDLAVLIGLISFTGLIATVICDKLLVHAERWNTFKYGIYTFIFGVSSYVFLQFLTWLISLSCRHLPFLDPRPTLQLWATLATGHGLHFSEVAWATGLSPFIAVAAVYCVNKKHMVRFAQRFRISNKYGDENLFTYYLNSPDVCWVYVRDPAAGFSYMGAVRTFSETKEVQEIALTDVTVYAYEDSTELYKLNSIYLSKPLGTFTIESPISGKAEESHDRQKNPAAGGSGTRTSKRRRNKRNKSKAAPTAAAPAAQKEVK